MGELREGGEGPHGGRTGFREKKETSDVGDGEGEEEGGGELTRHFVFRGRAAARGRGRKQPAPQGGGKKEERRGHFEKEGGNINVFMSAGKERRKRDFFALGEGGRMEERE